MSFSKTWCFALLLAVMFAPACVPKSGGQELVQDTPAEEEKPKSAGVQKQSIKIGETVTFGQYPQAIEPPEPIELNCPLRIGHEWVRNPFFLDT